MQSDIYRIVRERLSIHDYISSETAASVKKVGEDIVRVDPCLWCGHMECFTVYAKNQTFHCFSCGVAGDIVHIERHLRSLDSNREAAESLFRRFNLESSQAEAAGVLSKDLAASLSSASCQKNNSEINPPPADAERLLELREKVATFYHKQLLANEKALHYMTVKRGHNLNILQKLQIGFAAGDIIRFAKENGFSVDELIQIGIAKRKGNSLRAVIAEGLIVFPQQMNGRIAHFTLKDPKKKLNYQLPKKYAGDGWLCFGQDCLSASDPIFIVEGQDDLLSVMGKASQQNVICVHGNFNTSAMLCYLKSESRSKTFYLCFDRDEAGKVYTKKYSNSILAGQGIVKVIEVPTPHKDIDDFLKASKDPVGDFKRLVIEAKNVEPVSNENDSPEDSDKRIGTYKFSSFEILGELQDGRIMFWSRINRKTYITALKDLNLDKLVQIGGEEVIRRVSNTIQDGKIPFRTLKKILIAEASKQQLSELESLGQGIHLLKSDQILIICGGSAVLWDGSQFSDQEQPLVDEKFIEWEPGSNWIDIKVIISRVKNMSPVCAQDILDRAAELFSQWKFTKKLDYLLLTGWVFAQIVQTVWLWRPHLWMSGPQGSGKTLMSLLLERLGGDLALRHEGQVLTEPGLRQSIGSNSSLVVIDEFEKSQHRDQIIPFLRSAGRGGIVTKGSINQKAIYFRIRHMVFVCSIETGLSRAAENARFLVIETRKDPDISPQLPQTSLVQELRVDIFSYAIWAAFKARELVGQIKSIKGVDPRFVEAVAVPFSMIAACDDNPLAMLREIVQSYINEWQMCQEGSALEDEQKLLEDILMATVRVPETQETSAIGYSQTVYEPRTIGQLIGNVPSNPHYRSTLEAHGIKITEKGFFFHPGKIGQELLQKTRWQGLNIRNILLRLPGAEAGRDRCAGTQVRGVYIPRHLMELDEHGSLSECHSVTSMSLDGKNDNCNNI